MGLDINWRSSKGVLTEDNRDYCGVGLRDDAALCIVLDGSTSGAESGALARAIAHDLIDWFMTTGQRAPDAIIEQLRSMHRALSQEFRRGSASYVIAIVDDQGASAILHAGDCMAGVHRAAASLDWLTRPHTLANAAHDLPVADFACSPIRNRLTRSFRPREFQVPDMSAQRLAPDQSLVLATDGFWAALDGDAHAQSTGSVPGCAVFVASELDIDDLQMLRDGKGTESLAGSLRWGHPPAGHHVLVALIVCLNAAR